MGWAADDDLKKRKFPDEEDEEEEEDCDGRSVASGFTSSRPPDGGYGWLVLLASFILNMIIDGVGFSFGSTKDVYMREFNATHYQVSWVGSAVTGCYLIVGPVVGVLCFRFGLRKVTILGSLIASTGFVLSSFATSLEMLIATYGIIGGVGMGMMYLPSIVCVSYWFDKKLGIATGIAVCGSGLGQFLFPPLGTYLISEYQWQGKHLILGGIALHGVVCGMLFHSPDRWHHKRHRRARQHVEIERGIIMKALIEDKKRQRTISDGSLDNCVITTNNRLIKLEPSLFHCNKSQALRKMLRQLGYSIQSLAVSKSSLPPTDHQILMEALQQQRKVDQDNNSLMGHMTKRNSSPDFNKCGSDSRGVSRCNSITSNGSAGGRGPGGAISVVSGTNNTPPKQFPKTRSCDGLAGAQEPPVNLLIKKIMKERVRSNSECVTTSNPLTSNPSPLGSSPALPMSGSVDISIQEIPPCAGSPLASCYNSNTSVNTDVSSQFTREYVPNSSQNSFVTTCMISAHHLEASIRQLERQDSRDRSLWWRGVGSFMEMVHLVCRPVFALFLVSSLFILLAFYIPYFYIPDLGVDIGMTHMDAAFLPVILGITSTIGRLIVGWLGDRPWINCLYLNNGALLCAGVSMLALPFLPSQELLCVATAVLGFCLAVFVALRSVLLIKFLGVELIPKSFGLLCLSQGIAAFAGSPLAGKLADLTGSLDSAFFVAGTLTVVSGLILFPLGRLKARELRLEAVKQAEADQEAQADCLVDSNPASPVHCYA